MSRAKSYRKRQTAKKRQNRRKKRLVLDERFLRRSAALNMLPKVKQELADTAAPSGLMMALGAMLMAAGKPHQELGTLMLADGVADTIKRELNSR